MLTIGDGTVGKQGSKTFPAVLDNIVVAVNVEIRLLLAGKRGIREVFSCGR